MKIPRDYNERITFTKEIMSEKKIDYSPLFSNLTQEEVKNNIENFIGDVKIPLGIAGPLKIKGEYAQGTFLIPMATTEGALLASYSRGMKLINQCGGCEALAFEDYFIRAGVFITQSLEQANKLKTWCEENEKDIEVAVRKSSSGGYAQLKKISYDFIGKDLLVSFYLMTSDAMGSNMGSKACYNAINFIQKKSRIVTRFYLPLPEDKKFIPNRQKGKKVIARVKISKELLYKYTKAHIRDLYEFTNFYKNALARFGSYSLNIHAANSLASLFLALGQDMAYIGECSQVLTDMQLLSEEELEVSVTLPTVIIGTIGGGVGLPSFKTCLQLIDCYGPGKVNKLAEIMAATVLAGEINCCAAQCAGDFIKAHETMGKNRPND